MNPTTPEHQQLLSATQKMVADAGMGDVVDLQPIPGGGNNRGFLVQTTETKLFLKAYFKDRDDQRDRLDAEFRFSRYAWNHQARSIPQPIAWDKQLGLGLYSFVTGRHLTAQEADEKHVNLALEFWQQLNASRHSSDALELPAGSEACFSIADHLHCVDRRLERLRNIEISSDIDAKAAKFITEDLSQNWQRIAQRCRDGVTKLGFGVADILPQTHRCLSPSDFGFHNAMLTAAGQLIFFDFEYAGWDDPAKVVCDFFCQPRIPVSTKLFDHFASTLMSSLSLPENHVARAQLLLAVYRIKWCCIMLNEFQPLGARRRSFAMSLADIQARKIQQLALAQKCLRQCNDKESH